MPVTAFGANLAHLPKKSGSRSKKDALPFKPLRVVIDSRVADHPSVFRIMNTLRDVEADIVDDIRLVKAPSDPDAAGRQIMLTRHRGKALRPCLKSSAENFCCGTISLNLLSGNHIDCSYAENLQRSSLDATTVVYVDLEAVLREVSEFLAKGQGRFFRVRVGLESDLMALDPIIDFARVLIPFFASRQNAILELTTRTSFIDHILDLRHRNRTVISWPLNTPSIIESEERGVAALDERLGAAARAAAAGFGVGFHIDPVVISTTPDNAVAEYSELIDKALASVQARSIAWVSLGLLRFNVDLPALALKRFPNSRIFTGELVPAGRVIRYPRFVRERVIQPLWERVAAKLPAHKIYLCSEGPSIWNNIDPSVQGSACIEKRLCNLESLPLSF